MALNILQWNCRSIQNKVLQLQHYLSETFPDILCLHETHLHRNINLDLAGYHIVRKDRADGRNGGGICICVKRNIEFAEILLPNSINKMEFMAIRVSNIVILNLYNPLQCN